jgi:hypothetical protein
MEKEYKRKEGLVSVVGNIIHLNKHDSPPTYDQAISTDKQTFIPLVLSSRTLA